MKPIFKSLTVITLLILLISCHKDKETVADSIFHTWEVRTFMSIESVAYPRIEGNQILITFNPNGTYQLELDVNHCLGTFTPGFESKLSIGPTGCTKICCDSEFSIKLVSTLPKVTSWNIDGNSLNLNVPQWGWIECELVE
ncbi:MAG: META domain-containing protein [Prolixibacteraceae bacterium]